MNFKTTTTAIIKNGKQLVKKIIWGEKKKSFGNENAEKTFYVIRSASTVIGLYAYVLTFSGRIKEAIDRGYVPVIDMQSLKNPYLRQDQVGKINAWEFFYEQPCGYTMEDVRKSKNVVFASSEVPKEYPTKSMAFLTNEEKVRYWRELFAKYIRMNDRTKKYVDEAYCRIFPQNGARVLGVLARGTDYIALRPFQHPIQPQPDEIMQKAKAVMEEQNCEYVYLATEDASIHEMFRKEFGDKLLSIDVKRYVDTGKNKFITQMSIDRENDEQLKGLEYLTTIELLARCNCLVAGRAGGSVAARVLAKNYEYTFFYDLGQYGIDDV